MCVLGVLGGGRVLEAWEVDILDCVTSNLTLVDFVQTAFWRILALPFGGFGRF